MIGQSLGNHDVMATVQSLSTGTHPRSLLEYKGNEMCFNTTSQSDPQSAHRYGLFICNFKTACWVCLLRECKQVCTDRLKRNTIIVGLCLCGLVSRKRKIPSINLQIVSISRVMLKNSEAEIFDVFQETHGKMKPNDPIQLMFLQFCLTLTCFW